MTIWPEVDTVENIIFSPAVKREASRLLAEIKNASSMAFAVTASARGDGFIIGLDSAGLLREKDVSNLHAIFESALEVRLNELVFLESKAQLSPSQKG